METTSIKPRVFIGSSSEGLEAARALERHLSSAADVQMWTHAFSLGDTTMETLNRELNRSDYAVLVASSDDLVTSRGNSTDAPRDNVIFEAGLFMGRLGKRRSFVLCDRHAELKLPSDWAGLTVASYDSSQTNLDEAVRSAAQKIIRAIKDGGIATEVDFLRSYLTIFPQDTRIWDSYADILTKHLSRIRDEVNQLHRRHDWGRLLEVKIRLREYFEYSGKYLEAVEFGKAYVDALSAVGRQHEAAWSKIKDIGYMLILAGRHTEGRRVINEVLQQHVQGTSTKLCESLANLLFYAYRYMGISYQRDDVAGSMDKARECYAKAEEYMSVFPTGTREFKELNARLLRNLGNLRLAEKKFDEALSYYSESLKIFRDIEDVEHIGFAHLSTAEAIISRGGTEFDTVLPHLRTADSAFMQIGFIEGHGRVLEQQANYFYTVSKRIRSAKKRNSLIREALAAARSAKGVFNRMGSVRLEGRIDALIAAINGAI